MPVPAGSGLREYVRVKQLNLDCAGILVTCNLLGLEHTPACRGLLSVSSSCIKPLFIWRQEFLSGCDWIVTGSWLAAPAPHSLTVTRIPVKSCQNISQASVKSSHDTQPTLIMYTDL